MLEPLSNFISNQYTYMSIFTKKKSIVKTTDHLTIIEIESKLLNDRDEFLLVLSVI